MFFTSKQAADLSGCTLRQLQYWREQKVIVPTVDATGKGRSVFYSREDLVALMVMEHLLSAGLDYSEACAGLESLRRKEPTFSDSSAINRYFLSRQVDREDILIREFDVEAIQEVLKVGQPVIPLWLDQIHKKLAERLNQLEKLDSSEISEINEGKVSENDSIKVINSILRALGWIVISHQESLTINHLSNHAIVEYPLLARSRADYVLFVNGLLLGMIEAKAPGKDIQVALEQVKNYSRRAFNGIGNWEEGYKVPFLYTSNGEQIIFLDIREKSNLPRQLATFHSPQTLIDLLGYDYVHCYQWLQSHPVTTHTHLRPYQVDAIVATEEAIAKGKRSLVIAMASGTGKTLTIISAIYRLLVSKTVKRVLYLVENQVLIPQILQEFISFETFNGKKFHQEYPVYSQSRYKGIQITELPSNYLTNLSDDITYVYVCTMEQMKNHLISQTITTSDGSGNDEGTKIDGEHIKIPIHTFNLVVADECLRDYTTDEYMTYHRTVEYFDAIQIRLTATLAPYRFSPFQEIVYRYTVMQAIADGYLVDYEQINIDSEIKINKIFFREEGIIGTIDQKMKARNDEQEINFIDIERKITSPDINRKIIQEIADYAYQHEIETGRFPKILIFASNDSEPDSHADQLVTICRSVFARHDNFIQKITKNINYFFEKIQEFRNNSEPGIVITDDLLATGLDFPAIEFLVFLRVIDSSFLWTQMLGRGVRLCPKIHKTHFKIFDCFGGSLVNYFSNKISDFTLIPPRQQTLPIQQVISNFIDQIEPDCHLEILIRRFHRLDRSITPEGKEQLEKFIEGSRLKGLAESWTKKISQSYDDATLLLQNCEFQEFLVNYPRIKQPFRVAGEIDDSVTYHFVINGQKPEDYLNNFSRFIEEHSDDLNALKVLRQETDQWSMDILKELRQKLRENGFTEERLQRAYQLIYNKASVDIISLIRWTIHKTDEVYSTRERIDKVLAIVTQSQNFNKEQLTWLDRYMWEHLVDNLSIDIEDLNHSRRFARYGDREIVQRLFQGRLESLINQLNSAIIRV